MTEEQKILILERCKSIKLEGAIETARAVCHEMCQPLQGALSYVELMMMDPVENGSRSEYLLGIKACLEELTSITRKLNSLTNYEITDYVDGVKIIDINKASATQITSAGYSAT